MTTNAHPELRQFFAGYFHEDWPVDAATPDNVISSFISEAHPPGELVRLADFIDAFARGASDDHALEQAIFTELGCYYVPSADGLSAKDWLRHVSSRLRAASAT